MFGMKKQKLIKIKLLLKHHHVNKGGTDYRFKVVAERLPAVS